MSKATSRMSSAIHAPCCQVVMTGISLVFSSENSDPREFHCKAADFSGSQNSHSIYFASLGIRCHINLIASL